MTSRKKACAKDSGRSALRKGDLVMVISGGNKTKRPNKGQVGKILRFVGTDRVVVEGVNMITRHYRQRGPNQPAGKERKEASIHVSNVMLYVEKLKRPVRVKHMTLEDGRRVRGFINPETKKFEEAI